ncbi:MAG: hypothetical protein B7Y93_08920 [Micrococcales bacterium 32-70-13]|nr:MAG: hypothetical protein B7Y93_08920 [Micrococcales bacterium 32-70-13]
MSSHVRANGTRTRVSTNATAVPSTSAVAVVAAARPSELAAYSSTRPRARVSMIAASPDSPARTTR